MSEDMSKETVDKILNASTEEEQLALEKEAIEPTDNGWQSGDPENQPEQVAGEDSYT